MQYGFSTFVSRTSFRVETKGGVPGGGGGAAVFLVMLGGGLPPGCSTPDPISDQKMSFFTPVFRPGLNQYPFSDLACKKLRHRYLDYNSNKKDFLKSMSKSRISLSVLLIWNWNINTFVHSRSSLENHTLFQTKMNKVCTRFHTETAQKPYPLGWHIPIWLISIGEFPHPPPLPHSTGGVAQCRLFSQAYVLRVLFHAELSLRAGSRWYPPATVSMTDGYFCSKQKENKTKRTSKPLNSLPSTCLRTSLRC